MSNFPTIMPTEALANALANSQVQENTSAGGVDFLKMDFETGEWLIGRDQDIVTDDLILVNTPSLKHGWTLWSGGQPQKSHVSFTQPLPAPMAPIGEDVASEARSFDGALVDDQSPLSFDVNSLGGRKGVDRLLGAIKAHAAAGSGYLYPKVKLTSESYANKKRGGKLTFNPVFEVIAWCNVEGEEEPESAEVLAAPAEQTETAPEPETAPEAPKRRRRKAAADTPAEETPSTGEEEPKKRRRRKAA